MANKCVSEVCTIYFLDFHCKVNKVFKLYCRCFYRLAEWDKVTVAPSSPTVSPSTSFVAYVDGHSSVLAIGTLAAGMFLTHFTNATRRH